MGFGSSSSKKEEASQRRCNVIDKRQNKNKNKCPNWVICENFSFSFYMFAIFFCVSFPPRTRTTQILFSEKLPASNKCQTCMQRCGERGREEKNTWRREKISVCSGSWERRRKSEGKDFLMLLSEKLMQSGSGSARNCSRFITWRGNQNKIHTTKRVSTAI